MMELNQLSFGKLQGKSFSGLFVVWKFEILPGLLDVNIRRPLALNLATIELETLIFAGGGAEPGIYIRRISAGPMKALEHSKSSSSQTALW
jgi:hypothetical protein